MLWSRARVAGRIAEPGVGGALPSRTHLPSQNVIPSGPRLQSGPPREVLGRAAARDAPAGDPSADPSFDPLARALAQVAPIAVAEAAVPPAVTPTIELPRGLLKRIQVGGDRERAVARLEFDAGDLAGACMTIEVEHGVVAIELSLASTAQGTALAERLGERLRARGLEVARVEVV